MYEGVDFSVFNKIMAVGLCGRSGSGKGYVSRIFADFGIPSLDTDALYRRITGPSANPSECMLALADYFGKLVIADDNSLNREEMRKIVFGVGIIGEINETEQKNQALALENLNRITHNFIMRETIAEMEKLYKSGCKIVLIDAPLLFESGYNKHCEKNICVISDEETIISRIMKRDGISRENALKRLASQKNANELRQKSDYVIENNCEKDVLVSQIEDLTRELYEIYSSRYPKL